MSFVQRAIDLTFTLGSGNFSGTSSNQVKVSGLRIACRIAKMGVPAASECQLRIFGLTPAVYNQLISIYQQTQVKFANTVIVQAGDSVNGMATVFIGQLTLAQIDLNSQPDAILNVIAQTGILQALTAVPPVSYPAGASVDTIMSSLAIQMNLKYENHGVTAVLPKSYFPGTARQQFISAIQAAGINGIIDDGALIIWPKGGSRSTPSIPVLSPENGMIGYPGYSNIGLNVKTMYNPNVTFGGQVTVQSSIKPCNGTWTVYGLSHELESEMPDGQWCTNVQCSQAGLFI
jgi:hypothetical protein